jgi:hypothetical protein
MLAWPDWIEEIFDIEPDCGSGALECIIAAAFLAAGVHTTSAGSGSSAVADERRPRQRSHRVHIVQRGQRRRGLISAPAIAHAISELSSPGTVFRLGSGSCVQCPAGVTPWARGDLNSRLRGFWVSADVHEMPI